MEEFLSEQEVQQTSSNAPTGAKSKTKFSPLEIEAIQIMDGINYYGQRGIDVGEYCRAHEAIKPYYNTIINIANAFHDVTTQKGHSTTRISQGVAPVGLFETYKFLKDVTDDLKKISADENKKTMNPVHVQKALIRTGYDTLIKDNMEFYSSYPGYDYDRKTALLELGFPAE